MLSAASPLATEALQPRLPTHPPAVDKSHCYECPDEDQDKEVCRGTVKYEGLWEAGTNFHHRCVKAETKTYSHSLQYRVRFLQDVTSLSDGGRGHTRVLGTEMRRIPACQEIPRVSL